MSATVLGIILCIADYPLTLRTPCSGFNGTRHLFGQIGNKKIRLSEVYLIAYFSLRHADKKWEIHHRTFCEDLDICHDHVSK